MPVRRLTLADLDFLPLRREIVRVGVQFITEVRHPFPLKEETFFGYWKQILGAGIGEFYVVEDPHEPKIIGVMGAAFLPDPFSGEMFAVENFWFVTKSSRSGRAAIQMLRAFDEDAAKRGCKVQLMVHLEVGGERLHKFYERLGYVRAESTYRKDL